MTDYIDKSLQSLKYDYLNISKSSRDPTNPDDILSTIHNLFIEADEYVSKKAKGSCLHYTLSKIHLISQIPKPTMYDSYFFPKIIQTYIDENATYNIHFNCKIQNRDVNVYFVLTNELKQGYVYILLQYIHMMYMWIYILNEYASNFCSKSISIYIYLTPFEKLLPNNQLVILDTEHVNTAYTTGCKKNTEIVIYRSEEWFKVFIHETFHNFGLDFSDMNLHSVNRKLKDIFNVNIDFNLYESYCEFWARTINTFMYTYQSLKINGTANHKSYHTSFAKFKTAFKENMVNECKHSLFQALKILHFMDLNYKLISDKKHENIGICNYLYKEKTSVFSYYIITSLLINNYMEFMTWCYTNNNKFFQFKKTPGNLDAYVYFIYECCKNKNIIKNTALIEKMLHSMNNMYSSGLKMTSNDIEVLFA